LPVSWSHPDSSEPVTEGRNNCVKVDDHVRSNFRTSIFRNVETVMVLLLIKQLNPYRFRASTGREAPLTGSIPIGLQCTENLWQLQCQLDVFCRAPRYRRVTASATNATAVHNYSWRQYATITVPILESSFFCNATSNKLDCSI